jgi:hypothetical protein
LQEGFGRLHVLLEERKNLSARGGKHRRSSGRSPIGPGNASS